MKTGKIAQAMTALTLTAAMFTGCAGTNTSIGAILIGVPIGLLCAVYMAKFCPKRLCRILKPATMQPILPNGWNFPSPDAIMMQRQKHDLYA